MSIMVVGSVAFDTIKSQYGERHKILGGAATYFALAASHFTQVRVVAVVGDDFTPELESVLTSRGIDVRGIEHAPGKTFHWGGEYGRCASHSFRARIADRRGPRFHWRRRFFSPELMGYMASQQEVTPSMLEHAIWDRGVVQ